MCYLWNLFQIWRVKLYKNSRVRVQGNPFIHVLQAFMEDLLCAGCRSRHKGNTAVDTWSRHPTVLKKLFSRPPPATDSRKVHSNVLPEMQSAAGRPKDKTTQMNKGYEDTLLQRRYANGQQVHWPRRTHYIPGYYGNANQDRNEIPLLIL